MQRKKTALAVILAAVIGQAFSSAAARAEGRDMSKMIPDAADVVRATVILSPPGIYRRVPLTETALLASGCSVATDSRNIVEAVDILRRNLHDNGELRKFYLTNAVYLHLKDGSRIRYIFGDASNRGGRIDGWADNGANGSDTPFLTHAVSLIELRRWLRGDLVEKKDGTWCVANK